MASATSTFTYFNYPNGKDLRLNHIGLIGTATIAAGTYPANGIPLSFIGHGVYEGKTPFIGNLYSPTTGISYQFDPVNQSIRIYQASVNSPGLTTAAFSASANWGTSPTLALSSGSTQASASLTVTAKSTVGANPTVTYTFPQPYSLPPVIVCSRGNDSALTTGTWVVEDANTTVTSATFEFVGTPTANDNYVLDFIVVDVATNPTAPVVAGSFASSGWGTSPTIALENSSSTQNAFSLSVTCGSTPSANPTVTLTFPSPFANAPIFSCSGGVAAPTSGYWIFTGSTTTTASFAWIGTPTNTDVYILDAIATQPIAPALTSAAFAVSSGWGTSPVIGTPIGNQNAFQISITAEASTGSNPTVTLTIPHTLQNVTTFVVSRGDTYSGAGYWAVEDASSTTGTLIVKFVGTPTATQTYTLNAVSAPITNLPVEMATGGTVLPIVLTDTIYVNGLANYS